jgi:5'-3' exoribonuclease 1
MSEFTRKLDFFVKLKTSTDPLYFGLKIVLSGCNVPGEGEHKIMEYIRWYVNEDPEYSLETRHCMYGQDSDLIMLSLLTHQPNFCILREEVKKKSRNPPPN